MCRHITTTAALLLIIATNAHGAKPVAPAAEAVPAHLAAVPETDQEKSWIREVVKGRDSKETADLQKVWEFLHHNDRKNAYETFLASSRPAVELWPHEKLWLNHILKTKPADERDKVSFLWSRASHMTRAKVRFADVKPVEVTKEEKQWFDNSIKEVPKSRTPQDYAKQMEFVWSITTHDARKKQMNQATTASAQGVVEVTPMEKGWLEELTKKLPAEERVTLAASWPRASHLDRAKIRFAGMEKIEVTAQEKRWFDKMFQDKSSPDMHAQNELMWSVLTHETRKGLYMKQPNR